MEMERGICKSYVHELVAPKGDMLSSFLTRPPRREVCPGWRRHYDCADTPLAQWVSSGLSVGCNTHTRCGSQTENLHL